MELRVYRTFRWVSAVSMSEMRIGGRNPMKLKTTEELQYRNADGAWVPIPVVEALRPEHPHDVEDRKLQAEMVKVLEGS